MPLTGAVSVHEISFLSLSPLLLMGCLLIEGLVENNKLLEPPPPASLLNPRYCDLLAKQGLFLLLRKQPLMICISMWDQWSPVCRDGQVGGEGISSAPISCKRNL